MRGKTTLIIGLSAVFSTTAFAQLLDAPVPFVIGDETTFRREAIQWQASYDNIRTTSEGVAFGARLTRSGSWVGQRPSTPKSWAGSSGIAVTVRNRATSSANFTIRMDNRPNPSNNDFYASSDLVIPAGSTRTYVLWFAPSAPPSNLAQLFGDNQEPALVAGMWRKNFSPESVARWIVWTGQASGADLEVTDFKLVNPATTDGLIDRYGQLSLWNWSGKVRNDQDLQTSRNQENSWFASNGPVADYDGSSTLPLQTATGRWRVQRLPSGNFFFVTPTGKPFWSLGLNQVNPDNGTELGGREQLFRDVNLLSGAFGSHFSTARNVEGRNVNRINHTSMNLERKYGATWRNDNAENQRRRLPRWGFNTLGGWSSPEMLDGTIPYTFSTHTNDFSTRLNVPFQVWGSLPDPFTATFADWCRTRFTQQLASHRDRTNLVGIFVDNELSWGRRSDFTLNLQIALGALRAPANQPSKIQFRQILRAKYGTISGLNAAWGTTLASWDQFLVAPFATFAFNNSSKVDAENFIFAFADRYYEAVKWAVNNSGTMGMYLGSRNYQPWTPDPVIRAAERQLPVHSMNVYGEDPAVWNYLSTTSIPVLISECGYSSVERGGTTEGMSQIEVFNRAERATRAAAFMQRALSTRSVVGAHWFATYDMPASGRWFDGQSWETGLLDVTDQPDYNLVNAMRSIGQSIYTTRR